MRPKPVGFGLVAGAQQAGRPLRGELGQQRPQRRDLHHRRIAGHDQHGTVVPAKRSRHIITAWPVPSCSVCSANSMPGFAGQLLRAPARPDSHDDDHPLDAGRPHGVEHVAIIGRPQTGTSTLGNSDFIRVPLPGGQDDCQWSSTVMIMLPREFSHRSNADFDQLRADVSWSSSSHECDATFTSGQPLSLASLTLATSSVFTMRDSGQIRGVQLRLSCEPAESAAASSHFPLPPSLADRLWFKKPSKKPTC